jgi:hypothetical protein
MADCMRLVFRRSVTELNMSRIADWIAYGKLFLLKSQDTFQTLSRRMIHLAGLPALLLAGAGAYGQALNFGLESVGSTAGEQSVTVSATVSGAVSSVEVLTQGQAPGRPARGPLSR